LTVLIENQISVLCIDACLSGDVSLRASRKILCLIAVFTYPVVKSMQKCQ